MTSLPPEAAGPQGDAPASEAVEASHPRAAPPPTPTSRFGPRPDSRPRYERGERNDRTDRGAGIPGSRPAPQVQASNAPVELTLDLLTTPPDKVLPRLFGALERVSSDVTLIVLLRDTPEYIGVTASIYLALRNRGYFSDSARLPIGCQRLRIQQRRAPPRTAARFGRGAEPVFAPAPATDLPPAEAEDADWMDGAQPSAGLERSTGTGQPAGTKRADGSDSSLRASDQVWLPAPPRISE